MEKATGKPHKEPLVAFLLTHSTAIFGVVLVVLFFSFWMYYDQVKAASRHAVEHFGYPALFVLTWLSDTLIQPIPADVFVFGCTFGGATMLLTAFIAGLASSMGGFTGYYIGRIIGARRFARYFGRQTLRSGRQLFDKYGHLAVFVAGVSPIPYSAVCYMGGIFHMSVWELFIASIISRTGRYVFMGWLGYLL